MVQALGIGLIDSITHGREIIRQSFELVTYEPQDVNRWNGAYQQFLAVTALS